jgi:hypothetical protein
MADQSDHEAIQRKLQMFDAEEAAAWADYRAHKANDDRVSMGEAAETAFTVQERRDTFIRRAQQAVAQPQQRYVSDEQRAARQANELDVYDLAKIAGITPDEYRRQYSRLAEYKRGRGSEQK